MVEKVDPIMFARLPSITKLSRSVGKADCARIVASRLLGRSAPVRTEWRGHPIAIRPADSDLFVAVQVFGEDQYALPEPLETALRATCDAAISRGETPVIVDAGANVGFSSLRFADRFPRAHIVAIELDPTSHARLAEHVASIPAIDSLCAALWKDDKGVRLRDGGSGSWSTQTTAEGTDTQSVTLEAMLGRIDRPKPLILKLDIEGAERQVGIASLATIAAFDVVIIEPHDWMDLTAATVAPLMTALFREERGLLVSGENLVVYDCKILDA